MTPKPAGRVLDVGDDEVDAALLDERRDRPPRDVPARLADDVADEQNLHLRLGRFGGTVMVMVATAAVVDAGESHAQFPAGQRCLGPAGIDRDLRTTQAKRPNVRSAR